MENPFPPPKYSRVFATYYNTLPVIFPLVMRPIRKSWIMFIFNWNQRSFVLFFIRIKRVVLYVHPKCLFRVPHKNLYHSIILHEFASACPSCKTSVVCLPMLKVWYYMAINSCI